MKYIQSLSMAVVVFIFLLIGLTPGRASATIISYDMELYCVQDCNSPLYGTSQPDPSQPISVLRFSIDKTDIPIATGISEFNGRILDYEPFTIGSISFSNQDFVGSVLSNGRRGTIIETVDGHIVGVDHLFSIVSSPIVDFDFYSSLREGINIPGGRFWALRRREALPGGGSVQGTVEGRYLIRPVPEPPTLLLLLALGLTGLATTKRRCLGAVE